MFRDGNSSQQYLVNAVALEGSIVGPTLFPLYVNEFSDDFIYSFYVDNVTL